MPDNPMPRGEGATYDADVKHGDPDFDAVMTGDSNPLYDETPEPEEGQ